MRTVERLRIKKEIVCASKRLDQEMADAAGRRLRTANPQEGKSRQGGQMQCVEAILARRLDNIVANGTFGKIRLFSRRWKRT